MSIISHIIFIDLILSGNKMPSLNPNKVKYDYKLVEPLYQKLDAKGIQLPAETLIRLLEENNNDPQACVNYMVGINGELPKPIKQKTLFNHIKSWFHRDN